MKKRIIDILLATGLLAAIALIFQYIWSIGDVLHAAARLTAGFCGQLLLCRLPVFRVIKALPAIATGILALWGAYLFFFSASWSSATVGNLIIDYVTPFIGCITALILYAVTVHIHTNHIKR